MGVVLILITVIGLVYWFNTPKTPVLPLETETPIKTTEDTTVTSMPPTNVEDFITYENEDFEASFKYPSNWEGPEVYTNEDGFRAEIGTDKVYPYGTSTEERLTTKNNNYYVVVQFYKTAQNISVEEDNSNATLIRNIDKGEIQGVEYLSVSPENAQTEYVYMREAILVKETGETVIIRAQPQNIEFSDNLNWKETYEQVDNQYLEVFNQIVDSATF